jgi:hypothetical protein
VRKPDYSRLVTLDLSPTEAAHLVGLLEGVKVMRGETLGVPLLNLIDGTCERVRLQLRQLAWPHGHNQTPFPV